MELTKEYFEQVVQTLATKKDLDSLPTRDALDGLKSEVRAVKATVDDIAQTVDRIDKRDVEDSDAHAKNFVSHERRIIRIEKQLKPAT
jgi:hypothetical protein